MTMLAQYERARAALAEATRIDQVLPILDEIEHVKLYAKQIADRELLAEAGAFQMKAERHLGIVIAAAKDAGHFKQGRQPRKSSDVEQFPRATLEDVGVDRKLSSRAQRAASISERAFNAMVEATREKIAAAGAIVVDPLMAAEKEAADAKRKAEHAARTYDGGKVEDLHRLIADGFRAGAILADPPWHFLARSEKGEGRSASEHYTTDRSADFEAIKSLPVAELAAKDCVLFMWMVDWCPQQALEVIEAWGFAHKTTAFTWAKQTASGEGWHMGQGYWTRANPEACWLATRGHPKRLYADVRQLIVAPIMEHSRKPAETHERIERLVDGPYLELYARRERPRWKTWGNDGMSGLQVDSELGLRPGATTAKISRMRRPEEKRRRRETPPETRVVQKHGPSRAELEGRERREAADRTLTALICGDPAPGFSALDVACACVADTFFAATEQSMHYIFDDRLDRSRASLASGACTCWRCLRERNEVRQRMILCPTCGCKRCPKASDHALACTGSNEPGQAGSVYLKFPPDC